MEARPIQAVELRKGEGSIIRLKQANSPTGKSKFWYILYYVDGRQVRENSKKTEWKDAYDLLIKRRTEAGRGEQPASDIAKLRYEDLRDALLEEYRTKKVASLYSRKAGETFRGRDHFDKFFKGMAVSQITPDVIRKYIKWRQGEDDSDPTIRRQLIHLRAAFRLAAKEGKLLHVPYFPMPKDSEPAGRYVDPETFAQLSKNIPETLHPFFNFLYYTGCRIGAAKQIKWHMINRDATEVKIPGAIMKARAPLTIVLAGKGLEAVSAMLKKMFRKDDEPVFDITNYRVAWQKACHAVGAGVRDSKSRRFQGLRIHDLRCSAAINLIDAGVPEDIVMKIGGWKTKSMFSRYNVMNTDRIRNAMIQGGDYVAERMKQA
jgi:integrase